MLWQFLLAYTDYNDFDDLVFGHKYKCKPGNDACRFQVFSGDGDVALFMAYDTQEEDERMGHSIISVIIIEDRL
ncbi:hypothetical protein TVAGG3_0355420 [Trichomonas vaginalis G3]|uniref:hypothetical protein n=1 Tax=Trichomonas vaginalis (strain ATCC PRA-98 / G3) TaxID=412133 RepID=UPI0021E54324|nr:hypothetical protein TVAGG3_0355420 [Trichomonas vaginalis G3]KAI5531592.1 hypothetical protein TVAGG3_0355420 [Trichomonas vaginalis G3]